MASLLVLALYACQKTDLPPSGEEPPVFSTTTPTGTTLTAGVSGYYLYTGFDRGNDGVITFSGTFERVGCAPAGACANGVRFEIRNQNTGIEVLPLEAFRKGDYNYALTDTTALDTLYQTTLSITPAVEWTDVTWMVSGDTAVGPSALFTFQSPEPVQVQVRARSLLTQALTTTRYRMSLTGKEMFPKVRIVVENDSMRRVTAVTSGSTSVQYLWADSLKQPSFVDFQGSSHYAVTVTDAFGLTAFAEISEYQPILPVFGTPDVLTQVQAVVSNDPLRLGQVSLQWVDDQGRLWRSDRRAQPPGTYFTVNQSEDYEPNEQGQRTRKMEATFNCVLYSEGGEMRQFAGSSVFAVAY